MDYQAPKFFLPRPQRLYSWWRSYQKKIPIEFSTIDEILEQFDLKRIDSPKNALGGRRNANIIVDTSNGKIVLKCYKNSLDDSTIIQEHSILRHLSKIGFPAVCLVSTLNGSTLIHHNHQRYAVYEFIDGFKFYDYILSSNLSMQYITMAGELLGKLHSALKEFFPIGYNSDGFKSKTGGRWRSLDWFSNKLAYCVQNISMNSLNRNNKKIFTLARHARKLEDQLVRSITILDETDLPRQIIHNDYNQSNILYRKDKSPIIIDFEIARLDWRLIDIIDGWEGFAKDKIKYNTKKMKFFFKAYQNEQVLCKDEFNYVITKDKYSIHQAYRFLKQTNWNSRNYNVLKNILGVRDLIL
jgi:Ser/Thr protein kinase RdoA (MazF antagonist)